MWGSQTAETEEGERPVAENSNGRAIIIAAILVSFSIIGGSFFVASGLEGTRGELEAMTEALGELELAGGAAPSRPSRPSNRPDADREYDVDLAGAPVKGPDDAVVTIVEWSDFQCPFCNRVSPTLAQIEKEYGGQWNNKYAKLNSMVHDQTPNYAAHDPDSSFLFMSLWSTSQNKSYFKLCISMDLYI